MIAIIAILIGLLLPAVQKVREAASRAQCENNLKQVGLALHNYHDANNVFPAGQFCYVDSGVPAGANPYNRQCWEGPLLPYVEQGNLYNTIQQYQPTTYTCNINIGTIGRPGIETPLKTLICPSDPHGGKDVTFGAKSVADPTNQGFHGNYALCSGNTAFDTNSIGKPGMNLNGLFYVFSQTSIGSITDGTSNTLMGSELLVVPDVTDHDLRGRYYNAYMGNAWFSSLYLPNTTVPDADSHHIQSIPNAPGRLGTPNNQSARSAHTGGVNALMADGSIHFVSNNITPYTWQAAGSRTGGEVPGSDL